MQGPSSAAGIQAWAQQFSIQALPTPLQAASPVVAPVKWQEYLWDPARLHAWLQSEQQVLTEACSTDRQSNKEGQAQLLAATTPQHAVPQHLQQLLLTLLQQAADTGVPSQELIWTPHRLSEFLGPGLKAQLQHRSHSTCKRGVYVAEQTLALPTPCLGSKQLPSVVQLLPLVSSVEASKARAHPGQAGSSSSSDLSGSSLACVPEQATPQPSSSSGQLTTCWAPTPAAANADEVTSPRVQRQQAQCSRHNHPVSDQQPELQQQHVQQALHHQQQQGVAAQHSLQQQTPRCGVEAVVCQQQDSAQHLEALQAPTQQQPTTLQHQQQLAQLRPQPQALLQQQAVQQQQLAWPKIVQPQQLSPVQQVVQPQPQLLPLLRQLQQLHQAAAAIGQAKQQLPVAAASAQAVNKPSGMPRKEALPGDYRVVEDNAAWSASALTRAAATAASALGLPSTSSPADTVSGIGNADDSSSSVTASADASAQQKTAQAPKFGVLMLVHEKGVTSSEVWEAWEGAHRGKAVVRVHLKEGVSTAGLPGKAWVSSRQLPTRICSKWGCISLTAAILQAAADMLQQHPQLQHVALVSGQDVPVSAVPRDLRPGLSLFGRFQFGQAFDFAARQVASEVLQQRLGMSRQESKAWGDALVFHHTWMVLDRQLLLALISKQEELLRVGTVLNERFMQPDVAVAADEFILITAAMRYGFVKQVVQRKLHTHMSAVRRLHRQQVAATAGQAHALGDDTAAPAVEGARPAKQQRAGSAAPGTSPDGPAAAARAQNSIPSKPASSGSDGSSRADTAAAGVSSGSRPDSSHSRGSSLINEHKSVQPRSMSVSAGAGPGTDSSSGEQGATGRRSQRREQGSCDAAVSPEQLVGRRIKVWWEMDQAFYCGVVTYYSLSTKRHTVKYDDGDVEIINLARESWKLEGPPPTPAAAATASGRPPSGSRSSSANPQRSGHADAAASRLHEGTIGVLLDCCPTLALFHPTQTRHPHEWRNFTECLSCDVVSHRPGNNRLTLLDALGLAQPNAALFFRKVSQMQRQGPAQLLACLRLLWKNRPLPALIEDLQLE